MTNAPAGGSPYLPLEVRGNTALLPSDLRGATQVTFYTLGLPGLVYVKRAALGDEGYIVDHYSPTAIGTFIKEIAEPAIKACGPNPPTRFSATAWKWPARTGRRISSRNFKSAAAMI